MIGSAIAAGFVGTLVMTTIMRAASEFGLTRMDLALLLGTAVTENRRKARASACTSQNEQFRKHPSEPGMPSSAR